MLPPRVWLSILLRGSPGKGLYSLLWLGVGRTLSRYPKGYKAIGGRLHALVRLGRSHTSLLTL